MGGILSIDYGLKRIGLAISDESRSFAFPCGVIENKNFKFVLLNIKKIIDEKNINLVIVGMPYNMNKENTTKSEVMVLVEKFVNKLQESINIPVETIDERLSSFSAEEKLKESGLSAKKSKKFIDTEAARLILEEYLNP